jgi:fibronectin-binding autotransporter adhesin
LELITRSSVVGGLVFNADGYVIADTDSDGTLTIAGAPTPITVASNYTAKISDSVDGSGGLTKNGSGTLEFTTANTYAGVTRIAEGVLKMAKGIPASLGQTGAGNEVIIESGAALDLNAAYTFNRADHITVSGSGVNGGGAIFSSSANSSFNFSFGNLTLAGDTTLGVPIRWDLGSGGTLYGNGHTLTKAGSGQIAVSRAVNNCPIVINAGNYTVQNANALGGTDYATWVNGSTLYVWGSYTLGERIHFTGSSTLGEGAANATATFSGNLTVSDTLSIASRLDTMGVELSGVIDGPGSLSKSGAGWCYILNDNNSYAGTTTVVGSRKLWVGRPDGSVDSGRLGRGEVIVQGDLYYDRTGAHTVSNEFSSWGRIFVRNGGTMILSESVSDDSPIWFLCDGGLVLTNGCALTLPNRSFTMADRLVTGAFDADPTNVTARLTVHEGCSLTATAFICGNGLNIAGNSMTSIIHQTGGTVTSTGSTAEENGFRMAHYPGAYTTWTMSDGTMLCRNNYDICMATDGQGWLNVTGGDIHTMRIMLNERANNNGYGRFTLAGGRLFLGSPTAPDPLRNAINTDSFADYTYDLELGGLGAEIIAVTNIYITVNATLNGTNCASAVAFNSNGHRIEFSGRFEGTGGFRKTGAGTMEITSSYSPSLSDVCVQQGTLKLTADDALTNIIVNVSAGAVLDLGGHHQIIGGVRGPGAVVNGSYSATRYHPGTLIILY